MYRVTSVKNGTIYCERDKKISKAKLMGKITAIELKVDKNGKDYYSVFILNAGEKDSIRWNFFSEKGKL